MDVVTKTANRKQKIEEFIFANFPVVGVLGSLLYQQCDDECIEKCLAGEIGNIERPLRIGITFKDIVLLVKYPHYRD
jgi:hypothetical protein